MATNFKRWDNGAGDANGVRASYRSLRIGVWTVDRDGDGLRHGTYHPRIGCGNGVGAGARDRFVSHTLEDDWAAASTRVLRWACGGAAGAWSITGWWAGTCADMLLSTSGSACHSTCITGTSNVCTVVLEHSQHC